ncbi:MAG: gliding motility-associated C-terminal domain-containing protein [Bacteroidetes bacterium]|nr:gliding motility-associated C-terminal domain-containing protein [Bacteroidota bacterium]
MKKTYALICLMLFCVSAHAQLTSGLVAEWDFNGNATDVTGNGHNGTATNTTNSAGVTGASNTAYHFNGTNSYITVGYQPDLNVSSGFTVTAIIKPTGYYTANCQGNVILERGIQYSAGSVMCYYGDNAYDGSCSLYDTAQNCFLSQAGTMLNSGTSYSVPTIITQHWYCVIFTCDGSYYRTYVNGKLMHALAVTSGSIGTSTAGLWIGSGPNPTSSSFPYWLNADLDEVRYYNRVFSTSDVDQYCGLFSLVDTLPYIVAPLTTTKCSGDTLHVNYDVTRSFNSGNTFTVQLSNAAGSFASPTTISSAVTATTGGKIICTIPSSTPTGTGYRVRIISTSPVRVSNPNSYNITIVSKAVPTISSNSPVCTGDTIKLTATTSPAAATYNWTGPASFSSTLQNPIRLSAALTHSGTYKLVTNQASACKDSAVITVTVNQMPTISLVSNDPICELDTLKINATVSPSSTTTTTWSGPSGYSNTGNNVTIPTVTTANAGKYIAIANNFGCIKKDSVTVTINTKTTPVASSNSPVCEGDTLKLSVTSTPLAGSYIWSGPASFSSTSQNPKIMPASSVHQGSYKVISNLNGCKDSVSIPVVINPTPSISLSGTASVCMPDTIKIYATVTPGTSTISWTGPSGYSGSSNNVIIPNSTASNSGKYIIAATNSTCTSKDSITVTVNSKTTPVATTNSPICAGDTLKLMSTSTPAASSYSWSGPIGYAASGQNQNIVPATINSAGVYKVITLLNGCKDSATVTAVINPKPTISVNGTNPVCAGDTIFITATVNPATSSIVWSSPAAVMGSGTNIFVPNSNNAHKGKYIITAGYSGCYNKDSIDIVVKDVHFQFGNDTTICANQPITLSQNIDGNYLWQDGSTGNSYVINKTGKYYLTINDAPCKASDTINIIAKTISLNIGNDTLLCRGGSLTLNAADSFDTYLWNNGQTGNSITATEGSYWLQVKKGMCSTGDSIIINYTADPAFELGPNKTVCIGETAVLNANSIPGSTYTWQDGSHEQKFNATKTGTYYVVATNMCGSYKDSIVLDFFTCDCQPIVPTAFTPNNDGLNDLFGPHIKCNPTDYLFEVYDRWGACIFKSENKSSKWDGTYKGKAVEVGTYFYFIKVSGPNTESVRYKGDVMLIR